MGEIQGKARRSQGACHIGRGPSIVQVRSLEAGSKEQSPSRVKVGRRLERPWSEPEEVESMWVGQPSWGRAEWMKK